ncbi:MAG TPA: hypothetical protein VN229_12445, partial [Terriglobales bacterium]|nr:hypothetical protein [Terriglobales bacterium]
APQSFPGANTARAGMQGFAQPTAQTMAAAPQSYIPPMPTSVGATALQSEPMMRPSAEPMLPRAPERPMPEQRSFVAPPAMEPSLRAQPAMAEPVTPRAAEPVVERKKAPSLFEKVTSRFTSQPAARAEARPAEPRVEQRPASPGAQAPRGYASQPFLPQPEPRVEQRPQQPQLQLDSSDRTMSQRNEEDLLDIPAFLRRQAN